jgi:NADPH-dependent ferric siderophore reductase
VAASREFEKLAQTDATASVHCRLGDHLLVDLPDMATDRMLELVGRAGGPLADASLWHLEVVDTGALGPTMQRMVLTAPGLDGLRYVAGQDLMFRVPRADGNVTNRRYTIRSFDVARPAVTIDVSLHGAGPGTDWIRAASIGDRIDAIGPRGKITPRMEADWHFFIGDETFMPGALAMIEALPSASMAKALLEVDAPADEQDPDSSAGPQRLRLQWVHRMGDSMPGDASPLQEALADIALPVGIGHVYVAAEASVVRGIQRHLAERGLQQDQISAKAYWRRGLPNAEHGEPTRQD